MRRHRGLRRSSERVNSLPSASITMAARGCVNSVQSLWGHGRCHISHGVGDFQWDYGDRRTWPLARRTIVITPEIDRHFLSGVLVFWICYRAVEIGVLRHPRN
jgi:hypothetical protein